MEKNQIIELRIDDMLEDGRAFGRYDGCAVFISGGCRLQSGGRAAGAVPGDMVRAKITKTKKSSAEADLQEITEESPDRTEAECTYCGKCGGCAMQELTYEAQKRIKRNQVRAKLERLGGLSDPEVNEIIGGDTLKYYRNKAVFLIRYDDVVGVSKVSAFRAGCHLSASGI